MARHPEARSCRRWAYHSFVLCFRPTKHARSWECVECRAPIAGSSGVCLQVVCTHARCVGLPPPYARCVAAGFLPARAPWTATFSSRCVRLCALRVCVLTHAHNEHTRTHTQCLHTRAHTMYTCNNARMRPSKVHTPAHNEHSRTHNVHTCALSSHSHTLYTLAHNVQSRT